MKIAIIGAMKKEITFLLHNIEHFKENNINKFKFFEGNYQNHQLVIVESGIGKVASGILISALITNYDNIDLIINIGVSGGVLNQVNPGDIIVATHLRYADADATSFNEYAYGQIPDCPEFFQSRYDFIDNISPRISLSYHKGTILSGDQFFVDGEKTNNLITTYFKDDHVLCLDMESTALAQGAWFYGIDYLAIRAISDIIGRKSQVNDYHEFVEVACINSNIFLLEVLKNI